MTSDILLMYTCIQSMGTMQCIAVYRGGRFWAIMESKKDGLIQRLAAHIVSQASNTFAQKQIEKKTADNAQI